MANSIPITTHLAAQNNVGNRIPVPAQSLKKHRQRNLRHLSALILLCFIMFFLLLGNRPLWDVDEGMHAATSKDMVLSGDWITPQYNGENFYDKPVLFNWLAALSFLIFGFTEFAARLPAALLGTGCVLTTYFLGKRMFSPKAGLLGGAILATSLEFIVLSRVVVHDIALAFFTTLALHFFYLGYTDQTRRKSVWFCFYASLGLAVLSKGPIGVLLPGLIIFIFLLVKGRLNIIKDMQIGWGVIIFMAIAAPWYILIILKNEDYAGYFFIQQNLAYFFSGESRHPRPFYYYIPILAGGFFPWFLFLPAALFRSLRRGLGETSDGTFFLVLWFGAVFVFFSIASSKLSTYILPLFPAVSLLVASLWNDLWTLPDQKSPRKGILYPLALLLAMTTAALVYVLANPIGALVDNYGIPSIHINMLGVIMVACSGLIFFLFVKRHYKAAFAAMTGMVVIGLILVLLLIVPYINPFRSTKGLAGKLDELLPQGEKLTFVHRVQDTTLFYTDRKASILWGQQAITDYLSSDKRVFCIMEKKYFIILEEVLPNAHVWAQEGNKLLISNVEPL